MYLRLCHEIKTTPMRSPPDNMAPPRNDNVDVSFNSFDYDECMLWDVVRPGVAVADVPADAIIMAQAVRKGYADSYIAEW